MPPQRVLVIDRDAALAAAATALAALAASGEPEFDQVVIDLTLPGLDLSLLSAALSAGPAAPGTLAAAERRHIARVLEHTGGNRRRAAQVLGISRSTLLNKIRKYGIERVGHSGPPGHSGPSGHSERSEEPARTDSDQG